VLHLGQNKKIAMVWQVFVESSMPIINFYEQKGKVRKIHADRSPDEVYSDVQPLVAALQASAL